MTKQIKAALTGDPDAAAKCTARRKLLPCPFCGGEAKQYLSVCSYVACTQCRATTPQYQFDNGSIAAWNRRVRMED